MELNTLTITEAAQGLRAGTFTSRDIVEACLAAISQKDGEINAYLDVFRDDAQAQADAADERFASGSFKSMLDGIPFAIKDNMLISGKRCTAGSKILEQYHASYNATVVENLYEAGAVFLGKTNLDEFAMGSSTEHSAFGPTHNPSDTSRVPGGSSGGSAGSDTGGSIRQPASFCGIVGLKPTYGRVSRSGLIAMASSLDQIGPMTKTVEDSATLFAFLAGQDPRDATTHPQAQFVLSNHDDTEISGLRIGLPKEYFGEGLDEAVRQIVQERIRGLEEKGAHIVEVSLPHAPAGLAAYYVIMPSEVSANLARFDGIRYGSSTLQAEGLWEVYFQTRKQYFGDEVQRRIMLGTFALSAGYYDAFYLKAQKIRARIQEDFHAAFEAVDVIITPTSPILPFRFGERTTDPLAMYLADIYTVSANLAGIPALSAPAGVVNGLPVGVQIMGKAFDEETLFRAGKAIEQE